MLIRRFFRAPRLILTVATIGLAQALGGIALFLPGWLGADPLNPGFTTPLSGIRLVVRPATIDGNHLLLAVLAPAALAGLLWFLFRTEEGVALRGMAENLDIPGRMSVRAPMQWSSAKNGGFSTAKAEDLRRPVVEGRKWGPPAINVAAQDRDPQSLLKWMEHLIRRRRECPEIAFGTLTVLPAPTAAIVALRHDWGPCSLIALHNLGDTPIDIELQLESLAPDHEVTDLLGAGEYKLTKAGLFSTRLERYGYRWLRITRPDSSGP